MHKQECEALRRWAAAAPTIHAPPTASGLHETQDESDQEEEDKEVETDKKEEEYIAIPPEAIRCLARIMWRRKKAGSSSMWWKEINEMQSRESIRLLFVAFF